MANLMYFLVFFIGGFLLFKQKL